MQAIQKVNLSHLKKCHQDWSKMAPTKGGRLCESCQKVIIDLRNKTEQEIAEIHAFSATPVCGIYDKKLIQSFPPQAKRSKSFLKYKIALLSLIAVLNAKAKNKETIIKNYTIELNSNSLPVKSSFEKSFNQSASRDSCVIKGKILTENGEPAIFATVHIKNTKIGVSSDLDGNYFLNIGSQLDSLEHISLIYSLVGYGRIEKKIDKSSIQENMVINIQFKPIEITSFYIEVKQPLYKKVWRSIRRFL
jgi:hypothetical protein